MVCPTPPARNLPINGDFFQLPNRLGQVLFQEGLYPRIDGFSRLLLEPGFPWSVTCSGLNSRLCRRVSMWSAAASSHMGIQEAKGCMIQRLRS